MLSLVFPDPLVWQAGLEYAVEAVAELVRRGQSVEASFALEGPHLEAVAFASVQLRLRQHVRFVADMAAAAEHATLLAWPRVTALPHAELLRALGRGRRVITSDPSLDFSHPGLWRVPARDPMALADAFCATHR